MHRQHGWRHSSHLDTCCDFVQNQLDANHVVLVHCRMGVSRSASVVIAYIMRKYKRSLDDALKEVKKQRRINPNQNFLRQFKVWEELKYDIWEDKGKKVPKSAYQTVLNQIKWKKQREKMLPNLEGSLDVMCAHFPFLLVLGSKLTSKSWLCTRVQCHWHRAGDG